MESSDRESQIVALLTEIQLPLRHYVQSLMPGDAAAQDVAQQANATMWKKRDAFEPGTNFKAWAFSIARFEVLNHRKRLARDARLGLVFSDELEEVMTRELAQDEDDLDRRYRALQQCLAKLRPADRQLIMHRYYEAGTLRSFADQAGRSLGGLKVTLHRLRHVLQQCIERTLASREATS